MEAWRQLRLLLKRNLILTMRQPVILALELLWPILIFLAVMVMRWSIPPLSRNSCHYNSWALPTAGGIPFLQSLVCNIDNNCLNASKYEEIPSYPKARVQELFKNMRPLMYDKNITRFISALPSGMQLARAAVDVFAEPQIETFLDKGIPIKLVIKRNQETMKILKLGKLSPEFIEFLFNSYLKLPKLVELLMSPDSWSLSCDTGSISQLIHPSDDNETQLLLIAETICRLNDTSKSSLLQDLLKQLDTEGIIQMVSQVMEMFGRQDISLILDDISSMISALRPWMLSHQENSLKSETILASILEDVAEVLKVIQRGDIDFSLFSQIAEDFSPLYEHTGWIKLKTVLNHLASHTSGKGKNEVKRDSPETVALVHSQLQNKVSKSSQRNGRKMNSDPDNQRKYLSGFLDLILYLLRMLPENNLLRYMRDIFVLKSEDILEILTELLFYSSPRNFQNILDFADSAILTILNKQNMSFDIRTWEGVLCDSNLFFSYVYIPNEVDRNALQQWACRVSKTFKKIQYSLRSKTNSTPYEIFSSKDFIKKLEDFLQNFKSHRLNVDRNTVRIYKTMLQKFMHKLPMKINSLEGLILVMVNELSRQASAAELLSMSSTFQEIFNNSSYPENFRAVSVLQFSLWAMSTVSEFLNQAEQNGTLHIPDIIEGESRQEIQNLIELSPFIIQLLAESSANPILHAEVTYIMSVFFDELSRNRSMSSAQCSSLFVKGRNDYRNCSTSSLLPQLFNFTLESHRLLDSIEKIMCLILRLKQSSYSSSEHNINDVVKTLVAVWKKGTLFDLPPLTVPSANKIIDAVVLLQTTLQQESMTSAFNKSWEQAMDNIKHINKNHINRFSLSLQSYAPVLKQIMLTNGRLPYLFELLTKLLQEFSKLISGFPENGAFTLHEAVKNSSHLSLLVNWSEHYLMNGIQIVLFTITSAPKLWTNVVSDNNITNYICTQPVSRFLMIPPDFDSNEIENGRKELCLLIESLRNWKTQCGEDEAYSEILIRSFLWSVGSLLEDEISTKSSLRHLTSPLFDSKVWMSMFQNNFQQANMTRIEYIRSSSEVLRKLFPGKRSLSVVQNFINTAGCAFQIFNEKLEMALWELKEISTKRTVWTAFEEFLSVIRIGITSVNHPKKIAAIITDFVFKSEKTFDVCSSSMVQWQPYLILNQQNEEILSKFLAHICSGNFSLFSIPLNEISRDCTKMVSLKKLANVTDMEFAEHAENLLTILNHTKLNILNLKNQFELQSFDIKGVSNKWREILFTNISLMKTTDFPVFLHLLDKAESDAFGNPTILSAFQSVFHSFVRSISDQTISEIDAFQGSMIPIKAIPRIVIAVSDLAKLMLSRVLVYERHEDHPVFNATVMESDWFQLKNILWAKPNLTDYTYVTKASSRTMSLQLAMVDSLAASLNLIGSINYCFGVTSMMKNVNDKNLCYVNRIERAQKLLKSSYGGNIDVLKAKDWTYMHAIIYNYLFEKVGNIISLLKGVRGEGSFEINATLNTLTSPLIIDDRSNDTMEQVVFVMVQYVHTFMSFLEERKFAIPAFHTLHYILKAATNRIQVLNKSNSTVISLETLFPNAPVTQSVVRDLLPHLPEIITTFFWSSLSEGKLLRWIQESNKNMTLAMSLICDLSISDYLYNPDFDDSHWSVIKSAMCHHNYFKVFEELMDDPDIQPVIFETDIDDPINWDEIYEDSLNISQSINKLYGKKRVDLPLPRKDSWFQTGVNITRSARNPAVPVFLLFNSFFYKFCEAKYLHHFTKLSNQSNEIQASSILCALSKPVFSKTVVSNFSHITKHISDENGKDWKKQYQILAQSLHLKDIFEAFFGFDIIVLEKIENIIINMTENNQFAKDFDHHLTKLIAEALSMIKRIDPAAADHIVNDIQTSPFFYFADELNDILKKSSKNFELGVVDEHFKLILEDVQHLNASERWKNRRKEFLDQLPDDVSIDAHKKLWDKQVMWLIETFKSLYLQVMGMKYTNKLSPKWEMIILKSVVKEISLMLYFENQEPCISVELRTYASLISDIFSKLNYSESGAEFFVCDLLLMDLHSAYHWISRTFSLNKTVREFMNWNHDPPNLTHCSDNLQLPLVAVDVASSLVSSMIVSNHTHLLSCAQRALYGPFTSGIYMQGNILGNIIRVISSIKNSMFYGGEDGFKNLVTLFIHQLPGYTKVDEIRNKDFTNTTANFFSKNSLGDLKKSYLNLNWIVRNNFSAKAFHQVLCKEKDKNQYILLHERNIPNSENFQYLCNSNGTERIQMFLQIINESVIVNQLQLFQEQEFDSGIWLTSLLNNSHLIVEDLLYLVSNTDLLNVTSDSSEVFNKRNFGKLAKSLEKLMEHLKPTFEGSSILDFCRKLLLGFKGFQSLQMLNLFEVEYLVKELVKDSHAVQIHLMENFHISEKEVQLLLNTRVNESQFQLLQGNINPCEFLDYQSALPLIQENMTVLLCYLNKTGYVRMPSNTHKEISLTDYVKKFVELAIDGILLKASLTRNNAKRTFGILKEASVMFPEINRNLDNVMAVIESDIEKKIYSLNLTTQGIEALGTAEAFNVGGSILCGKSLKTVQNKFSLITSKGKAVQLDDFEIKQMPNEFCQHGYKQVMNIDGGPIVWSFLKPLFRGKILYTPNNGWAQTIIKKMNETFEGMVAHVRLLESMAKGITGYRYLEGHMHTIQTIKNHLVREPMSSLLKNVIDQKSLQILHDIDLKNITQRFKPSKSILEIVELIGNISQCFTLDRFLGFASETDLEKAAGSLHSRKEFIAAVVFIEERSTGHSNERITRSVEELPFEIKYKIRMDIDNVPSTKTLRYRWWRPYAYDDFFDDLRYFRGFIQLQDLVDTAILELHTSNQLSVFNFKKYLQQFPYPCHQEDKFGTILKSSLPAVMTISWLFIIAFLVREIVLERELSLDEIMRVMGLRPLVSWMSWFLSGLLVLSVSVLGIVIILKAGGIMPHSNSSILFLFIFDFAVLLLSYCYLMSVFFKHAPAAALIAIIIYVLSFFPFLLYITWEVHFFFWQKIVACCLVATAFCFGCLYFNRFEDQGQGVQWNNIWISPVPHENDMNLGVAMIIMLFCSIAYFLLAWYISRVWPVGREATKQPWYFLFTATYWGFITSTKHMNDDTLSSVCFSEFQCNLVEDSKNWSYDDEDESLESFSGKVGISIKNLDVTFKRGKIQEKKAVDRLNLHLYEGHITTLLGHNGAGKTTTIKVLTGRCNPTSGNVIIYGVPIIQGHLSKIRKLIGYCPQYNILYDKLTVREHLLFFASLKGILSATQLGNDVDSLLKSMGLMNKQNELCMNLSGGQKRRLCVALAFVGGSKVIILDEPTSSVDPVARRSIWELIMKHKQGRTIVLCTHHLDEADILSNRVAVLHKGKLLCCGSPLFLKTKYGYGYQLSLCGALKKGSSAGSDCQHSSSDEQEFCQRKCGDQEIVEFIQYHVPLATVLHSNASELLVSLPHDTPDGKPSVFSEFFDKLDQNMQRLGLHSYSISSTSLEQVFLTLCAVEDSKDLSIFVDQQFQHENIDFKDDCIVDSGKSKEYDELQFLNLGSPNILTGWQLKLSQAHSLLRKRYEHTRRNWKLLTCAIVLPCLFIALAMALTVGKPERKPEPSLLLSPALYFPGTLSFVGQNLLRTKSCLLLLDTIVSEPLNETICFNPGLRGSNKCLNVSDLNLRNIIEELKSDEGDRRCICETEQCMSSSSEPIFIRPHKAIFNLTGYNIPQYLIDSYILFNEKRYGGWTCSRAADNRSDFVKAWFDNSGYHAAPSYLSALNNAILKANKKSSPKKEQYGIKTLNHPLQLSVEQLGQETLLNRLSEVGISIVFLIGLSLIPSSFSIFIINERVREEKRLQWVGGVGPFLYWSVTIIWDMLLLMTAICLCSIVIASFSLPTFVGRENFPAVVSLMVLFGWATTPMTYVFSKCFQEASLAFMVLFSINLFIGLIIMLSAISMRLISVSNETYEMLEIFENLALVFPQYSLVGGLNDLAENQIQSEILSLFGQDTYVNPFTMQLLIPNFLFLIFEGLIFFVFNIMCELYFPSIINIRNVKNILNWKKRDHHIILDDELCNSDVLKVENVDKIYVGNEGIKYAIKGLSMRMPKGECFGLLGVNGAGKTTLFRMLTAQISPSEGRITIDNMDVSKVLVKGLQLLGYCPQGNALDNLLTPRQHLEIYAQIRGIPWKDIPELVSRALSAFDLLHQADRQVGELSGGNKRKICTCIAMLGDPELLLLDEPTSGMDPMTKRLVWQRIQCAIKNRQSVIFSSHSIEESDILCSRIGIMVNGSFCALETPHQLKHKYGIGYTIMLRTSTSTNMHKFIRRHFPSAEIKAHDCDTVEFYIPSKDFHSLSEIFKCFEDAKDKLKIVDLAINETTLDQVFVDFARQQSDGILSSNVDPNTYDPRHMTSSKSGEVHTIGTLKRSLDDNESSV